VAPWLQIRPEADPGQHVALGDCALEADVGNVILEAEANNLSEYI